MTHHASKSCQSNDIGRGNGKEQSFSSFPSFTAYSNLDPNRLSSEEVIQLQRTLGNQAVTKLMAQRTPKASIQTTKKQTDGLPKISQTSDSDVKRKIQRLIGFEIETRIPLYEEEGMNLEGPDYDSVHVDVGTGDNSEVGVDIDNGTSIIEFVSGPVDDSQKSADFRQTAQSWINVLSGLHTGATSGPPPKRLDTRLNAAPNDLYYGFKNTDDTSQQDLIAIQATHGVRLDKAAEYLAAMSIPRENQKRGADQLKHDALQETGPAVSTLMTNISANILDPSTVISKKSARTKAVKELRGFFSLLGQYLISGGKLKTYYIKNHSALFYKSKMSDVAVNLILENEYAAQLFSDKHRANLIAQILADTNRNGGDPLFMGRNASTVTCQEWLQEVLIGQNDRLFEEGKNDWGNAIAPGRVKGHLAAIMEHRDLLKEFKPQDDMNLTNPDEIVNYLVQIFKVNKARQDIHHG